MKNKYCSSSARREQTERDRLTHLCVVVDRLLCYKVAGGRLDWFSREGEASTYDTKELVRVINTKLGASCLILILPPSVSLIVVLASSSATLFHCSLPKPPPWISTAMPRASAAAPTPPPSLATPMPSTTSMKILIQTRR